LRAVTSDWIGIDIGKNSFHVVGLNERGALMLRQKWSRGQVQIRFANMPPCLIGMEPCVGAHHRKTTSVTRRPAPRRCNGPTMKFVATKTADQLDLQALTRHSPPLRNRMVQTIFMEGGSMRGIEPLP
jgi:transposase